MRKREVWETDAGVNGIVGRETRVAPKFSGEDRGIAEF